MMLDNYAKPSPCDQYLPLIHDYVVAQLENDLNLEKFADLRDHLDECADCAKFYMIWYDTVRRANEGSLPVVETPGTREAALAILAKVSGRPPKPPHFLRNVMRGVEGEAKRFMAALRKIFESKLFVYFADRVAQAVVTVLVVTLLAWGLTVDSHEQPRLLSGGIDYRMPNPNLPAETAQNDSGNKSVERGSCLSPLPTPPVSPLPTPSTAALSTPIVLPEESEQNLGQRVSAFIRMLFTDLFTFNSDCYP